VLSPPQSFLDALEDRLNLAVFDINESHRMGLPDAGSIWNNEQEQMSITGLKSGAFQDSLAAMRQRLIDKQAAGVAVIHTAAATAEAQINEAVTNAESKVTKEVADALQEFAQFTNGGPEA
jgi:hypothetical protein